MAEPAPGDESSRPVGDLPCFAGERAVGSGDSRALAAAQRGLVQRGPSWSALGLGRGGGRSPAGRPGRTAPRVLLRCGPSATPRWRRLARETRRGAPPAATTACSATVQPRRLWGLIGDGATGGVGDARRPPRTPAAGAADPPRGRPRPAGRPSPARPADDRARADARRLGGRASGGVLEAALNEARVLQLVSDESWSRRWSGVHCARASGGCGQCWPAERGPALTRSEAERRLRWIVEQGAAPMAAVQRLAPRPPGRCVLAGTQAGGGGGRIPGARSPRGRLSRDRRRDQQLAAEGFVVVRMTPRQLRDEPMAVLARLAQALVVARARRRVAQVAVRYRRPKSWS